VGIVGETIEAVGPDSEIRSRCRSSTTVLELEGAEVSAGFCDAHTHPFWQGLQLGALDLTGATSLRDLHRRVEEASGGSPPGGWLLGFGWDESGWPERELPGRESLDETALEGPVYLGRVCGHLAAVNSAALAAVDLEETSGLELSGGRPTGRISGATLVEFFNKAPFSREDRLQALRAFTRACDVQGVTSVHAFVETSEELEALSALEDGPNVWVYGIHRPHRPFPWREAQGLLPTSGTVRLVGVKLYADGSIGARTASLSRPYEDMPDTMGRPVLSAGDLKELMMGFHAAGAQVAVHAIGDAAIEEALAAAEASLAEGPKPPLAPRMEHLELIHPLQLHRLGRLGIVASLQPNFVARWGQASGMYERRLGTRFRRMNPLRAFASRGGRLCFGSDCMPFGPLYGLAAAGLHPDEGQRLRPSEALRWYTRGGAEAVGLKDRGLLVPGYKADLAVLAPGSLESPLQGSVIATIRAGRLVWQAQEKD
jgi:predicted amidohydrolase YtcJ